jgi:hypothetical protein
MDRETIEQIQKEIERPVDEWGDKVNFYRDDMRKLANMALDALRYKAALERIIEDTTCDNISVARTALQAGGEDVG